MSVLVPWPKPAKRTRESARHSTTKGKGPKCLQGPSASSLAELALTSTGPLVNSDVSQTLAAILIDLAQIRPLKEQLQKTVEIALEQSTAKSLRGCRLEVVGSSSWHGDVPQSDLDLVLFTPEGCTSGSQAVEALKDLRRSLEEVSWSFPWGLRGDCDQDKGPSTLQQMEVVEMVRVPILRMHCAQGLHCDISVDQHHSVRHRDLLKQLLASQPEARDLVRLVKFWLRRHLLPGAPEGGVPSLAWAIIAVRFAQSRPKGSCIEELFCDFFAEMQQLNDHSLCLRRRPVHGTPGINAQETHFEWLPRGGSSKAWADEWLELLSVEDPCTEPVDCLPKSTHFSSITSPSMPAALGLLYIVDLRLAFTAIREGRWYDVWRCPAQAAPSLERLMVDCKMHVVLKDGQISIGKMQDVKFCKGLLSGHVLNRRDQSSQLAVQVSKLREGSARTVYAKTCNDAVKVACEPCHWVCALPMGPRMVLLPEGLTRLAEIIQVVGITRISPDLCDAVLSWTHACAENRLLAVHCNASISSGEFAKPKKLNKLKNKPLTAHRTACQFFDISGTTDSLKDLRDDSTRASTSDSESQSTSGGAPEFGVCWYQAAPVGQSASGEAGLIDSSPQGSHGSNDSGPTSEPAAPKWADIEAENSDDNAGIPVAAWHGSNDIGLAFQQAASRGADVVAEDSSDIAAGAGASSEDAALIESTSAASSPASQQCSVFNDVCRVLDCWHEVGTAWHGSNDSGLSFEQAASRGADVVAEDSSDIAAGAGASSENAALIESTSAACSSASQQCSVFNDVRQVSSVWKPTLRHNLQEFRSKKLPLVTAIGRPLTSQPES